jgi:lysozyme family protein
MNYESIIDAIIAAEKGYVDHPSDRGGPTNYGITQAVARRNGYDGDMRDLPISLAREIYRKRYIAEPQFDRVAEIDPKVGHELIDTGVNMGPSRAAEFFQRSLNVFNKRGTDYPDIFVDGRIGPDTLAAFRALLKRRGSVGSSVMFKALNSLQGTRYIEIAEGNESQEDFTVGWYDKRVS